MGDKLPVVGCKEFVRFLVAHGFKRSRQKGSHIILTKEDIPRPIVVPEQKELSADIVMSNLKTANITRAVFIQSMRKKK